MLAGSASSWDRETHSSDELASSGRRQRQPGVADPETGVVSTVITAVDTVTGELSL